MTVKFFHRHSESLNTHIGVGQNSISCLSPDARILTNLYVHVCKLYWTCTHLILCRTVMYLGIQEFNTKQIKKKLSCKSFSLCRCVVNDKIVKMY